MESKEVLLARIRQYDPKENGITSLVQAVEDGDVNALSAYIYLSKVAKAIENALANIKHVADPIEEAQKNGTAFEMDGCKIVVKSNPTTYRFSDTHARLKEAMKAREALEKEALKAAKAGGEFIDKETGEIIPPATEILGALNLQITVK